jgi:hypothetical protein
VHIVFDNPTLKKNFKPDQREIQVSSKAIKDKRQEGYEESAGMS